MKVYLTLDYELFMGEEVGTVDNCLIKPTEKLINILDKYNAKATFFVDAAYLYRLSQLKDGNDLLCSDFEKVKQQLIWLVTNGHDVQLHIHPQWYNATYQDGKWMLTTTYYKLSDLDENEAYSLFFKSKDLLESIINKPVIAFRAGGYSIQTFQNINKLFKESGIRIDSSALPMKKSQEGPQAYDYTAIVPGVTYTFNDNIEKKEINGFFTELPITTCRQGFFQALKGSIVYHLTPSEKLKKYGDGKPVKVIGHKKKNLLARIIAGSRQWHSATIDSGGAHNLLNIFRMSSEENVFVIIGHPKNLSDASLRNIDVFFQKLSDRNGVELVSSIIE